MSTEQFSILGIAIYPNIFNFEAAKRIHFTLQWVNTQSSSIGSILHKKKWFLNIPENNSYM